MSGKKLEWAGRQARCRRFFMGILGSVNFVP